MMPPKSPPSPQLCCGSHGHAGVYIAVFSLLINVLLLVGHFTGFTNEIANSILAIFEDSAVETEFEKAIVLIHEFILKNATILSALAYFNVLAQIAVSFLLIVGNCKRQPNLFNPFIVKSAIELVVYILISIGLFAVIAETSYAQITESLPSILGYVVYAITLLIVLVMLYFFNTIYCIIFIECVKESRKCVEEDLRRKTGNTPMMTV